MRVLVAALALLLVFASAASCADTYCQSGPKYGTSCYSGATVRPQDPLAPIAPPPPGYGGPLVRPSPPRGEPPAPFHASSRERDASSDAEADSAAE